MYHNFVYIDHIRNIVLVRMWKRGRYSVLVNSCIASTASGMRARTFSTTLLVAASPRASSSECTPTAFPVHRTAPVQYCLHQRHSMFPKTRGAA